MEKGTIEHYLNIVQRWWWLLIITTLIASAATYWAAQQQPPVYEAKARLIVGPGIDEINPSYNALRTGGQLIQAYAELALTRPLLQAVVDELQLSISPETLEKQVSVQSNSEALILTVEVQSQNPEQAALIANTISDKLVGMSPSGSGISDTRLRPKMLRQTESIEKSIADYETTIEQLEAILQTTWEQTVWLKVFDQLSTERGRLSDAHRTLASIYETLQEVDANKIKVIEPAVMGVAADSELPLKLMIGAMAGLILGLVTVLGFEYFDDTLRTLQDLTHVVNRSIIGTLTKHKMPKGKGSDQLIVEAQPQSQAAQDYRLLATKLLFSKDKTLHSILLLSPHDDHETGVIAANLAITMAQLGKQVILVDTNLQRPTIDYLFNVENQGGLTNLLSDSYGQPALLSVDWIPGLSIIPSGPSVSGFHEQLTSPQMTNLIAELKDRADIVLFVTPTLRAVGTLFLASQISDVVLAVRAGETSRKVIPETIENLRLVGADMVGVIFDQTRYRRLRLSRSQKQTRTTMADNQLRDKDQKVQEGLPSY